MITSKRNIKTYSELITFGTRLERLEYLMLFGRVGEDTFGHSRYLNQAFYKSDEWKQIRNKVIIRDNGCDLGLDGYQIKNGIIHHINPITREDILERRPCLFDLDNLILVSKKTHDIIHYAFSLDGIDDSIILREPNDTKLW